MPDSAQTLNDRQPRRDVPDGHVPSPAPEHPLAKSLKRVVRRILRTQARRTGFEARVLEEARRLVDGQYRELARDLLERLVVSRMLGDDRDRRFAEPVRGASPLCFATQLRVSNSTLALHAFPD